MARGTSTTERAKIVERQSLALDFRKQGMSYRKIAERLSVTHMQAYRDVQSALKAVINQRDESSQELQELELERLDMLLEGLAHYAKIGNVPSVLAFLKVSESRRKLLGLDAPIKADVTSDGEKLALPVVFLPQVNDDNERTD